MAGSTKIRQGLQNDINVIEKCHVCNEFLNQKKSSNRSHGFDCILAAILLTIISLMCPDIFGTYRMSNDISRLNLSVIRLKSKVTGANEAYNSLEKRVDELSTRIPILITETEVLKAMTDVFSSNSAKHTNTDDESNHYGGTSVKYDRINDENKDDSKREREMQYDVYSRVIDIAKETAKEVTADCMQKFIDNLSSDMNIPESAWWPPNHSHSSD